MIVSKKNKGLGPNRVRRRGPLHWEWKMGVWAGHATTRRGAISTAEECRDTQLRTVPWETIYDEYEPDGDPDVTGGLSEPWKRSMPK